jgi:hypothetical protein
MDFRLSIVEDVWCGGRLDFSAETLRSLRLCGESNLRNKSVMRNSERSILRH